MQKFLLGLIGSALTVLGVPVPPQVSVNIGTLQPHESVTVSYEVVIESPITPGVTQISSQGTLNGDNFSSVNTDDPETIAADDATVTLLSLPVATPDTVVRATSDDVKVNVASLLGNDSDPENDTLTITSVGNPTPAGATVSLAGNWIYYTHNGPGAGSFTYTISDGNGGGAIGLVSVNIQGQDAELSTAIQITVDGSGAHMKFNGIPNTAYTVQYTDSLSDPWEELGSTSVDSLGLGHYDDASGTPARFYRFVYR